MKLFTDDSRLLSVINEEVDMNNMQKDSEAVTEWSNTWGMNVVFLRGQFLVNKAILN